MHEKRWQTIIWKRTLVLVDPFSYSYYLMCTIYNLYLMNLLCMSCNYLYLNKDFHQSLFYKNKGRNDALGPFGKSKTFCRERPAVFILWDALICLSQMFGKRENKILKTMRHKTLMHHKCFKWAPLFSPSPLKKWYFLFAHIFW